MMTKLKLTLVLLLVATVTFGQKSPKSPKSPKKEATGKVGETTVTVNYSAPSVKGRVIWGELVPYDKVWRAGANQNTTITFDKDILVTGKKVSAGKYGLFVIPTNGEGWTVILSKKNDSWGTNGYDEANDLMRFNVKSKMADQNEELMTFSVNNNGVEFAWEKARFLIPIK